MGADKNIAQAKVLTDINMATAGAQASRAMRAALLDNMSFQATWSGSSPVGKLDVQVSNDHQENGGVVMNAGTWVSIYAGGTVPDVTGNTGTLFLNLTGLSAAFVRVVYTKTSGTGTLQCYFNARSI